MRYTKEQDITITDGVDFTSDMLHLAPDAPRREYYSRKKEGEIKTSVHWGQRKLLMSEIAFLVYFWDPKEVPHPIVVYAGAACGDHIPLLPDLFPQIKEFHLYDPEPFSIDPTDKLRLYSQLFTVDTAKEWSGRDDVLFISDIRTGDYTKMTSSDNEKAIIEDMELQKRCVEIIQPVQAHLKFRLPYSDFDEEYMKVHYLDGYAFLQPWAPHTSTETRLVPVKNGGEYTTKVWDAIQYEEQLFYHNTVYRSMQLYNNPFLHKNNTRHKPIKTYEAHRERLVPLHPPELTNDYDSMAEVHILRAYFGKFDLTPSKQEVCDLSDKITVELNRYTSRSKTMDSLRKRSIEQQRKLKKNRV
uniref:Cap-specific mRNA (nucleoside-2'-O-)-methyltransferase n=1 Tax=Pithovirus LCPAC304 TaxID=2506594 RepID=A0A481Z9W6_9VIRU|nr:MAG: poly a polymerase regulatory subunit [Pithovirus LCPAC304]